MDRADMFTCEDKQVCAYRKRNIPAREPRLPIFPLSPGLPAREPMSDLPTPGEPRPSYGSIHQHTVERFAPPSLLIDSENNVVHSSSHAGRYMRMPGGEPTTNVFKLVSEPLRVELRAAVHSVRESKESLRSKPLPVVIDGETTRVILRIQPALDTDLKDFLLIIFDELREKSPAPDPDLEQANQSYSAATVHELEAEIELYRQRLQSVIEEYESSREEMQASNEELQSANEELRSTLEELETSKEELQSMNEELATVNQENRHRVEELSQLSGDLQNLMAATAVPTLFLDRDLRIVRFTPQVSTLFNILHTDRGRPLSDLTHRLGYTELQADARKVLKSLTPVERETGADNGRWYLARLLPYRTDDDRIEGVVITLIDITERREAEDALLEREARYRTLAEMSPEAVLVSRDGQYVYANQAAADLFRATSPKAIIGRQALDFFLSRDVERMGEQITRVLSEGNTGGPAQYTWKRLDGSVVEVEVVTGPIDWEDGPSVQVLARDITPRKLAEQALRDSEDRYRSLFRSIDEGFCIIQMHFNDDHRAVDYSFIETNPVFEQHTGLKDVIGRRMSEFAPDHERYWYDRYGRIALTGEPERFEAPAKALGDRVYEVYGFRFGEPEDRKVAVLFSDITQRKVTEEKLLHSREALEEAVNERTRELETQKSRLQALAHQLASAEQRERKRLAAILHDELQQYLVAVKMRLTIASQIAESSQVAETLKECAELSDQAMASSRDLTRQLRPPVLFEDGLIAALRWLAGEMLTRHGLEVSVESPDREPPLDEDIRSMLFESVRELLLNVIKHAKTDEAALAVKYEPGRLTLVTKDCGEGFDLEAMDSRGQEEGFGLFSVGERIEAIGGTFSVDSAPGKGTTITLSVPLATAEAVEDEEKSQARIGRRRSKKRRKRAGKKSGISVLVIDDHAIVRRGVVNLIDADSRIEVIGESSSAIEAIADIEKLQPEIVIMDINLPGVSGIEATRQIVAKWPHILIIGLSVQDDRATRKSMLQAGAKGFISKSDPVDVMVETIVETKNANA